jgi:hypothetical protein
MPLDVLALLHSLSNILILLRKHVIAVCRRDLGDERHAAEERGVDSRGDERRNQKLWRCSKALVSRCNQ